MSHYQVDVSYWLTAQLREGVYCPFICSDIFQMVHAAHGFNVDISIHHRNSDILHSGERSDRKFPSQIRVHGFCESKDMRECVAVDSGIYYWMRSVCWIGVWVCEQRSE